MYLHNVSSIQTHLNPAADRLKVKAAPNLEVELLLQAQEVLA
jgi:hypothetical protein